MSQTTTETRSMISDTITQLVEIDRQLHDMEQQSELSLQTSRLVSSQAAWHSLLLIIPGLLQLVLDALFGVKSSSPEVQAAKEESEKIE